MKFKVLVYQHVVETYATELSDEDAQKFLDGCSLTHESGEKVTLDELHKVYLGTMGNFLVRGCGGISGNLYTLANNWMTKKVIHDETPEREIEDSNSSVTTL